jgi:hypothetical protein
MKEFFSREEVSRIPTVKHTLLLIERVLNGKDEPCLMPLQVEPAPVPIVPIIKLLNFGPLECARQLKNMECALFVKFKTYNCLLLSWEEKNNADITVIIETTNKALICVTYSIVLFQMADD